MRTAHISHYAGRWSQHRRTSIWALLRGQVPGFAAAVGLADGCRRLAVWSMCRKARDRAWILRLWSGSARTGASPPIESLVVLVLNERITAFVLAGIAPILIGVALGRRQKQTSPPPGSADL